MVNHGCDSPQILDPQCALISCYAPETLGMDLSGPKHHVAKVSAFYITGKLVWDLETFGLIFLAKSWPTKVFDP